MTNTIRLIHKDDYYKDYLGLLETLTVVGRDRIDYDNFTNQLNRIGESNIEIYVVEKEGKIIGSATLIIEPKIIHFCGYVGHVEDVVVLEEYQGQGYGKRLIEHLTNRAKERGCYKIILDCYEKRQGFYEKCGFELKGVQMAKYF